MSCVPSEAREGVDERPAESRASVPKAVLNLAFNLNPKP